MSEKKIFFCERWIVFPGVLPVQEEDSLLAQQERVLLVHHAGLQASLLGGVWGCGASPDEEHEKVKRSPSVHPLLQVPE